MKSNKILSIVITVIALIGAFLFVRVFLEDEEVIKTDVDLQNTVISPIIYYSTYLFLAAIVITVLLSIWTVIKNPENLKKLLMSLAVLGVLLLVAYFMADTQAVYDANGLEVLEGGEEGSSTNKWVGTGIWYSTILLGIAGLFFVYDLLKGLVKS